MTSASFRPEAKLVDIPIFRDEKGIGFQKLAGCLAATEAGEVIKAVVLDGDVVEAIVSGSKEWTDADMPSDRQVIARDLREERLQVPYMTLSTEMAMPGITVVPEHGVVHLLARGFRSTGAAGAELVITLDAGDAEQRTYGEDDGTARTKVAIPPGMSYGEHVIEVIQELGDDRLLARASFVVAAVDEVDQ